MIYTWGISMLLWAVHVWCSHSTSAAYNRLGIRACSSATELPAALVTGARRHARNNATFMSKAEG